jgi:hypothetical protein
MPPLGDMSVGDATQILHYGMPSPLSTGSLPMLVGFRRSFSDHAEQLPQHPQQQQYRGQPLNMADDDMDEDARSFSSLRIVPFQDKPYHREWRTAVLRRKREQLARAVDGLSGPPSAQAAQFHREIISQSLAPSPEASRRWPASPVIPRHLPKSDRVDATTNGDQANAPYPFIRKDAKKRKEVMFTYFGQPSQQQRQRQRQLQEQHQATTGTCSTIASHPLISERTLAAIVASVSYWKGQLNCADSPAAASASENILTRCMGRDDREGRQDEERTTPGSEAANSERKEAPATTSNGSNQASSGANRRPPKAQKQRSQVALEVIKLQKELKRLKHIVQEKKSKKDQREREVSPAASSQATIAPFGASKVRFTDPMVTNVSYRPFTDPEDIDELYFDEDELNELEWDRQTVADDQYEVTITGGRGIRIFHQKRRLLALHGAQQDE